MAPTRERLRRIAANLGFDANEAVRAARALDNRRFPEPSARSCNKVIRGMVLETMWRCDPERFGLVLESLALTKGEPMRPGAQARPVANSPSPSVSALNAPAAPKQKHVTHVSSCSDDCSRQPRGKASSGTPAAGALNA